MAAIWRNRELEVIVGGPLAQGGLTAGGIAELVGAVRAESEFVEYKDKGDLWKNNEFKGFSAKQERAKDICAPANTRGAILIYGVTDNRDDAVSDRLKPFTDFDGDADQFIEQFKKDVRQFATPIPLFDMFAVDADPGYYLVAVVPPSIRKPHAVKGSTDDRPLYYFQRATGESHVRAMAEHEIAELYAARQHSSSARREQLETAWTTGVEQIGGPSHFVAAAIMPDAPADGLLTRTTREEIIEWERGNRFPDSILHSAHTRARRPIANQGRLEYRSVSSQNDLPQNSYRELYVDGTAFAAVEIPNPDESTVPLAVDIHFFVDACWTVLSHSLLHATSRVGAYGNATIRLGLLDGASPEGRFGPAGVRLEGLDLRSGPSRRVDGLIHADQVVHLDDVASATERLRIAHTVISPVIQRFGYVEPHFITDTGAIRHVAVRNSLEHMVSEWAQHNDVEFDRESWWLDE
ncbi:ATP-binding protein [Nocardia noduli]|uniref:ATP-binding protein n=1 Tax=Nocardia noduli TaxID=2815722 RepID=UPI001C23524C|nr:ATP-binding protein [Nocardia noduli]